MYSSARLGQRLALPSATLALGTLLGFCKGRGRQQNHSPSGRNCDGADHRQEYLSPQYWVAIPRQLSDNRL